MAVDAYASPHEDGLPVLATSEAAIAALLAADGLTGAEPVGRVPPLGGLATTAQVAVQALRSGCAPGHLAVVLAALRAIQTPAFNALGVLTTTGSAACAVIVNGPAIDRLGFNGGANSLGPGSRANAAVGRALGFVTRNLGLAVPGVVDMATMGQPGKYTFCFAENERDCPWEPLHVERGLPIEESAVTVVAAAGTIEVVNSLAQDADELLESIAQTLGTPSSVSRSGEVTTVGGGQPLVLLSPEWAEICQREGLDKHAVKEELWRRARCPVERLPRRLREAVTMQRQAARQDPSAPLPVAERPEDVLLIVTGGVGVKQTVIPNWNGGSRAVTVSLRSSAG